MTGDFFQNCVSFFSRKLEASLPGPCPRGPTCLIIYLSSSTANKLFPVQPTPDNPRSGALARAWARGGPTPCREARDEGPTGAPPPCSCWTAARLARRGLRVGLLPPASVGWRATVPGVGRREQAGGWVGAPPALPPAPAVTAAAAAAAPKEWRGEPRSR